VRTCAVGCLPARHIWRTYAPAGLAAGIIGALIARFRSRGMARAPMATAVAQAVVAGIAPIGGLGRPWSGALELSLLDGCLVALFLLSAWLFS
jgi:hypothetical protein